MKEKFLSLSRFSQISVCVIGAHILGLFIMTIHHVIVFEKPKNKMVVRQVVLQASKEIKTNNSGVKNVELKGKAGGVSSDKKGVSTPKLSQGTVKKSQGKPVESKSSVKVDQSIFSKIDDELKELDIAEKRSLVVKKTSAIALPQFVKVESTQEDKECESFNYKESLMSFLQGYLELPEFGSVKVNLVINGSGKVVTVDIIESKSQKNSQFLKNKLQDLDLSGLNQQKSVSKNHEFIITFKNEERIF